MKKTALKVLIASIVSTVVLMSSSICAFAADQGIISNNQNNQAVSVNDSKRTIESNNQKVNSESIKNTNSDKVTPTCSNLSNTKNTASIEGTSKVQESTTTEKKDKTVVPDSNSTNAKNIAAVENTPKVEATTTTGKTASSEYSGITDLGNTSIGKAAYQNLNTMTYGQIKKEGEQRWYLTKVDKGKKLTVFLGYKAESAIDLNLYLFKYDETKKTITQVAYSALTNKTLSASEQLSYISDGGYYFICVNSASGFDTNNKYQVVLVSSDKYDSAEADDSISQRKIISGIPTTISQTIDNDFDVDWIQFTVPENKNISGVFQNTSSTGKYKMTIYDHNLNCIGTLTQGQNFNGLFTAGAYLIKVESISGCDPNTPYTITFTPYDGFNTRKIVSDFPTITDSINSSLDDKWIEYSTAENKKIIFNLTNPNSKMQYVVDLCTKNSDGKMVCFATVNQGDAQSIFLKGGTYYFRVRSINGYDPNTKYTLSLTPDPCYLCSTDNYVVTTNSSRNELYINGAIVSLNYVPSSAYYPGGDASSHVTTGSNSRITNYGIVNYKGKTCVCIEVSNTFIYTWIYANKSYHMESLTVPLGQFVIDLATGQCIDGGVLQWT